MIPDPLIYTGVASFVTGWAVWFQGRYYIVLVLLALTVLAFAARLVLDRRSRRRATV